MTRMTVTALAIGLIACGGQDAEAREDVLTQTSALTNGARDESDDGVAALAFEDGTVFCTGTLIAPRFVLTAAHCVAHEPSQVVFARSSRVVKNLTLHPEFDPRTLAHDVGIVEIESPADRSPIRCGDVPAKNTTVRLVGYGRAKATDSLSAGTKHWGEATIRDVLLDDHLLELTPSPAMACSGDSGGPVFSGDRLIGVVSFGDEACGVVTFATSVAAEQTFIDGVLNALPPPSEGAGCSVATNRKRSTLVPSLVALALLGRLWRSVHDLLTRRKERLRGLIGVKRSAKIDAEVRP